MTTALSFSANVLQHQITRHVSLFFSLAVADNPNYLNCNPIKSSIWMDIAKFFQGFPVINFSFTMLEKIQNKTQMRELGRKLREETPTDTDCHATLLTAIAGREVIELKERWAKPQRLASCAVKVVLRTYHILEFS